jgi:hypothetical protein
MYTDVKPFEHVAYNIVYLGLKKNIQIFTFDLLQNKTTTFYLLDANTFSYECTKVE